MIKLFIAISLLISLALFRGTNILGGGESGAPFYDLTRMLEISDSPWLDALLGAYIPQSVANTPLFFVLSFFQRVGVPGFFLQGLFFFPLLFLSLFSMYRLIQEFFPNSPKIVYLAGSLFYLFNPYSLINIWNRFLLNFMLFYSILPLLMFLYLKGLKSKKYFYSILTSLFTALFSYAFSIPVSVILLWLIFTLATLFYFFQIKREIFAFKFWLATFITWFLFNFWWLSQQIYFLFSKSFGFISGSLGTSIDNQLILTSISQTLGKLSSLFLLHHASFLRDELGYPLNWPLFYTHPASLFIQWLLILVVLYLAIRKLANPWVKFLLSLFILAIFLTKGNASPLGEVFGFFFDRLSLLQFFRNPFEKFGVLLAFSISPLFGLAAAEIVKKAKISSKAFLILILLFFGFPFFSGLVFTGFNPPLNDYKNGYQVKVPQYYQEADKWLDKKSETSRFISLPIGGEGIKYNWKKGYLGVEQSAILFSTPSVSYAVGLPFFKNIANSLEENFMTADDFYKIAGLLNAKHILFRPDVDFKRSGLRDPETIEERFKELSQNPETKITKKESFGPLSFFEMDEEVFVPKVYAAKEIFLTEQPEDYNLFLLADGDPGEAIITPLPDQQFLSNFASLDLITNSGLFEINTPFPQETEDPAIFPYVSHRPDSSLYPLVRLKEKIELLRLSSRQSKVKFRLLLLGKRLEEARMVAFSAENQKAGRKSLQDYIDEFPRIVAEISSLSQGENDPLRPTWFGGDLFEVFSGHLFVIEELEESRLNEDGLVSEFESTFRKMLSEVKIMPQIEPLFNDGFPLNDRKVYQFNLTRGGEYEILLTRTKFFPADFDFGTGITLQIDGRTETRNLSVGERAVSLGKVAFDNGVHEISFNQNSSVNLIEAEEEIEIKAENEAVKVEFPIGGFNPFAQYEISFDYWVKYGDGVTVAVRQNTDMPEGEKENFFFSKKLAPDNYFFDQKYFFTTYNPSLQADEARLVLKVEPWNNCRSIFFEEKERCDDPEFERAFDRPTDVVVSNLKITPKGPGKMILVQEGGKEAISSPHISFSEQGENLIKVEVSNSKDPLILVFSELFDPNWQAEIVKGGVSQHVDERNRLLANGYANAWLIDEKGDFEVLLKFRPTEILVYGYTISGLSIVAGVVLLISQRLRRRKDVY